ncbi:MAG: hypothetical protein IPG66_15465 [Hydrogenophilales bacterium]|nr:hypothetical protein [Hydrogenophilales bacterium]
MTETIKTPWVRESLSRREAQLAEKYLAGYLDIERSLKRIEDIFSRVGIQPPKHGLSGYLEVDAPRMKDLESAYANRALGEPARDVQRLHRAVSGEADYIFTPAAPHACDAALFKTLAGIMTRIVDAEDRLLLLEQWAGKKSSANISRDAALRSAQQAAGKGALPVEMWNGLATGFETAYAWGNVKWEGSEIYGAEVGTVSDRLARLRDEYRKTLEAGEGPLRACLRKMLSCGIGLSNPAPEQGDVVTATATVTPSRPPQDATWLWRAEGAVSLISSGAYSAKLRVDGDGRVGVDIVDAAKVRLATCGVSITVRKKDKPESLHPPKDPSSASALSVTVPDIWKGASHAKGFKVERAEAKGGPLTTNICGYRASVRADVTGTLNPSFAPRGQAEIDKRMAEEKIEHARWSREAGIRPYAIGNFKGALLETKLRYRNGGWSDGGYRDSHTEAMAHGWLLRDGKSIEVHYHIRSDGCFNDSQRAFQEAQSRAA